MEKRWGPGTPESLSLSDPGETLRRNAGGRGETPRRNAGDRRPPSPSVSPTPGRGETLGTGDPRVPQPLWTPGRGETLGYGHVIGDLGTLRRGRGETLGTGDPRVPQPLGPRALEKRWGPGTPESLSFSDPGNDPVTAE